MTRGNIRTRLERLEAAQTPAQLPALWHQIIAETDAEAQAVMASMVVDGWAKTSDNFILRMIVDPPQTER
jgi:hypothetical protein